MLSCQRIFAILAYIISITFFMASQPADAAETTLYSQNFELDNGGYTTDGNTLWGWDAPLNPAAPLKTNTSGKCWGTSKVGTQKGTLEASLYSPPITMPQLGTGQLARVSFNAYVSVNYEQYGEGDFYISTDDKKTWQLLGRFYEMMTETGWQRYSFNISAFAGKTVNFRFRAYMQDFDPGFYIDDVKVIIEEQPHPTKLLTLEANESGNPKASCPWVFTWDGSTFVRDNDIFSVGRYPAGEMRDFYLLQKPLVSSDANYNIEIQEVESEDSWTDLLGLWTIDHEPDTGVAPDNKGNLVAYKPSDLLNPQKAFDQNGSDVLAAIGAMDGSGFAAYSNDYIDLDFGAADVSDGARLILRVKGFIQGVGEERPFIGPPAIVVQTLGSDDNWREVGRLNPRFDWSVAGFDLSPYLPDFDGELKVRLRAISHGSIYHQIDFAGLSIGPEPAFHKQDLNVQSAFLGGTDITGLLATADNRYVNLTSGNKFSASFAAGAVQKGLVRDFVLVSEGYYIPRTSTFFVFTWDGQEWLERESYSFAATDSQQVLDLSSYLPDPDGEYKVRIWQDYANWPAAIDYVSLQVGPATGTLTKATDLRDNSSILSQVQNSDDVRLEYPLDPLSHLPRNRWSEYRWSILPTIPAGQLTISDSAINWGFFDAAGKPQAAYQLQVWTAQNAGGSSMWDTGEVSGTAVSALYGGAPLTTGTVYYLRARVSNGTAWSGWSETSFTANITTSSVTVTFAAGQNGSISGETSQTAHYGAALAPVTAVPGTGYHFLNWTGLNGFTDNRNPLTIPSAIANDQITANFAINSYTVTITSGANGTITPAGAQTANYGTNITLSVTPATGFVPSISGSCGGQLSGTSYVSKPITADCTIDVAFSMVVHTVTAAAGTNGLVTPPTQSIADGAQATVTITPAPGFQIESAAGCGGSLSGNTYTTGPTLADCSIIVTFVPIPPLEYLIKASSDEKGTIVCDTPVHSGVAANCIITPATGYRLSALVDNGADVLAAVIGSRYVIADVEIDHTVTATFAPLPAQVLAGDLDGDGKVDLTDALRALRIALGLIAATDTDLSHGDVADKTGTSGSDGTIDILDVMMILKKAVHLAM